MYDHPSLKDQNNLTIRSGCNAAMLLFQKLQYPDLLLYQ